MTELPPDFQSFLSAAKQNTYAGADDDTSLPHPLLEHSKQLEFRNGSWLYRDIYFGMSYFSGLETVYFKGRPFWTMAYSGGTVPNSEIEDTRELYSFLRAALRRIPIYFPVRGPIGFSDGIYTYTMIHEGDLTKFSGTEYVHRNNKKRYSLTFSGGVLR